MRYAIALALTSLVVGCADRGPADTVEQFYSTVERESESRELYDMTVGVGWEAFLVQKDLRYGGLRCPWRHIDCHRSFGRPGWNDRRGGCSSCVCEWRN